MNGCQGKEEGRISGRENREKAVEFKVGWGRNDKFGFGHIKLKPLGDL